MAVSATHLPCSFALVQFKILKSSFKNREQIQKKEHGPYSGVSAIQVSSVTLNDLVMKTREKHNVIS